MDKSICEDEDKQTEAEHGEVKNEFNTHQEKPTMASVTSQRERQVATSLHIPLGEQYKVLKTPKYWTTNSIRNNQDGFQFMQLSLQNLCVLEGSYFNVTNVCLPCYNRCSDYFFFSFFFF